MEFRQDIQILRGLAVLFVVFYHLKVPFFDNGFLGVDLFFVISGFLMAKLYDRDTVLGFYKRRIDRLLPAYVVTILLTLCAATLITVPVDFKQLFDQAIAGLFFSNNIHFWSQNSYFNYRAFNPLLHLWSLGVEAQFYLIVPFLFPFLRKRAWLLLAMLIGAFGVCLVLQTISPKTSFFMMPLRLWEFLIGAFVAWQSPKLTSIKHLPIIQISLLLILGAVMLSINIKPDGREILSGHPGIGALITCVLAGLILYSRMPQAFENSFAGKGLRIIGDYSYSLYLAHFPIIVFWNYENFGGTILGFDTSIDAILMCGLMGLTAFASYHLLEKKRVTFFRSNQGRLVQLGMIVLLAFAGLLANKFNYSKEEQNIFAAWEDRSTYRCGKLFRILNPTQKICPINNVISEQKILFVGDSHADAIKTSFAEIAKDNNIALYFYVDNNPLMHKHLNAQKVLSDAINLKSDAIVLHYRNIFEEPNHKQEIQKLIENASQKNITVTIIAPSPEYELHIPRALYEKQKISKNWSEHNKEIKNFSEFVETLENTKIYDPSDIICPQKQSCLYVSEELKPYYFDKGHLTLTGSILLKPLFQDLIDDLEAPKQTSQ
ncbi:MAG: acyltransferase family protein [Alphaproteobacteria bacterium]|nr:acyltransferase family protein [Alphaproteobacteria bacterium]